MAESSESPVPLEKPRNSQSTRRTLTLVGVALALVGFIYLGARQWIYQMTMHQLNDQTGENRAQAAARRFAARPVKEGYHPVQVLNRSLPPITNVPTATAEQVARADAPLRLQDNELVLGIQIDGQARAYPINSLTGPSREIINDTLGGSAIAATW